MIYDAHLLRRSKRHATLVAPYYRGDVAARYYMIPDALRPIRLYTPATRQMPTLVAA